MFPRSARGDTPRLENQAWKLVLRPQEMVRKTSLANYNSYSRNGFKSHKEYGTLLNNLNKLLNVFCSLTSHPLKAVAIFRLDLRKAVLWILIRWIRNSKLRDPDPVSDPDPNYLPSESVDPDQDTIGSLHPDMMSKNYLQKI